MRASSRTFVLNLTTSLRAFPLVASRRENMKIGLTMIALVAGLASAASAYAEAPVGSTGECKDGTYTEAASRRGACAGHGGVKTWFGKSGAAEKTTAAPAAAAPAPATAAPSTAAPAAAAPTPAATPKPAAAMAKPATAMPAQAAPGGGPGKVWVNASTKVYHCPSDRWYGKTKDGEYMTEADAKAKGDRPASGKPCS
jgi:hypothetical protein